MLAKYQEGPISFDYQAVTAEVIFELKATSGLCIIHESEEVIAHNAYFRAGYHGSHRNIYTRLSVLNRLQKINVAIGSQYGLYIFDVFRTTHTQAFLFHKIQQEIKAANPKMSQEALEIETRKFVSHPDEPERFAFPPHNTGGAVDLGLFDKASGELIDFGADFDQTDIVSSTDFFEGNFDPKYAISEARWFEIRKNRRLLFNAMKEQGFTNYETEWWHYDLGDCLWALNLNTEYVYPSLEPEVLDHVHEHTQ